MAPVIEVLPARRPLRQIPVLPSDKMFVVAFVDHGTVESRVEIKDYRVSVGSGVRIAIPCGPSAAGPGLRDPDRQGAGRPQATDQLLVGAFGSQ